MLIWNPSKLTTAGKALLAKAQAGQTSIQITKAQTGSGSYSSGENLEIRTALKAAKQTFPIQNKVINADNTLVLKVAITNKGSDFELQAGYDITEFGIFAQDPQKGEILYSIATASTSDYMPAYNGVIPSVINMSYYLEVANAANVTINSAGAIALQADLEALEERVSVIEQNKVELLGVRKKVGASSSAWERIGDAIGMVCKAAVGNGTVQNDMMSHFPFNEMKPCNLAADRTVNAYLGDADFQWDGSNGDVMLEVPMTYTGRWFETDADGVKWEYRAVSSGKIGHLHLDHLFTDGADRRISEKVYIPIFNGSLNADGDKLESKAGAYPLHNKTRAQFRTLCTAKGENWYLDDVWAMHFLDTCFLVMFANSNAQAVIGKGISEMPWSKADGTALQERTGNYITVKKSYGEKFSVGNAIGIGTDVGSSSLCIDRTVTEIVASTEIEDAVCVHFDGDPVEITMNHVLWPCCQKTGATIGMASPNGRVEGVDGRTAVRFLWIEDWFGNGWQFRDGDNINKWQHYYCNDRSAYADKVYTGSYFEVGYKASEANGYVSEFGYDPEWPEIEIATKTAGGSTTFWCDYYYQAEGGEVVISGGGVFYGTAAGPFCRGCYSGAGYSYWDFLGRPQARK